VGREMLTVNSGQCRHLLVDQGVDGRRDLKGSK
jgi:hypothetical protein